MRILYVNDAWAIWGGLERVLIEKMNYLADDEGLDVFTITYNQGDHPFPYPLSSKVIHRDLDVGLHRQYSYHGPLRFYFKYKLQTLLKKRLQSAIESIKPDVIVCPRIDLIDYILKAKGNIPLIYESHSSCKWIYEYEGLLRNIKRYYYESMVKKVQMVVALTEGDAAEWRKLTPNVSVIPNVVHLNNSNSYSDCTAKSVIFVGRFSKQKDVGSLLRIWDIVHQRHSDWTLHIYGGHADIEETILTEIKMRNANITIHEPTSDIIEKYKESSVLLLTSRYEPFGLVLPEAMSCGVPIVSFDCPYGPEDIITDGVDGFLIRHRSIEDFANKLSQLMDHQELRQEMGKAGIESSRRYEVSKIMPLWKKLFEQLTN
jgi:glycosyltransferase involved in cell wall biosynthesis